jgi:hypothetical protein
MLWIRITEWRASRSVPLAHKWETRWKEIVENLYPFQATHLIFRAEDLPRRSERLLGEVGEKKGRNGAGDASDRENRVLAI